MYLMEVVELLKKQLETKDPGMLDISGFDAAVPTLISDFSAGRV